MKIRKSLYSLKQAGRVWYTKITEVLNLLGYIPSVADPCLFVKTSRKQKKSFILLYVDDIFIMSNTEAEYEAVRMHLENHYVCW